MTGLGLTSLSGTALGKLIEAGEVTSRDIVAEHLAVIERTNPVINAVVDMLADSALRQADECDGRRARRTRLSPIDGVPFSIKDSLEVRQTHCSAGTLGSKGWPVSVNDATLVARLRAAGAIPLARTNLPDLLFAFESDNLLFGRTNNPYGPDRTSGGSSGGEAALIAVGGSPFGLGSDCAGSVRVPAHYCGIASLKPTSGRLARTGHVPPSGGWVEALWQIGPMARWVEDLVTLFPLLLGSDGVDRTVIDMPHGASAVSVAGLRVGVFTHNGIAEVDDCVREAVEMAAQALSSAGAKVDQFAVSELEQAFDLEMQMLGADGGDALRAYANSIGSAPTHHLLDEWLAKLQPYRTDVAGLQAFWARLDGFRNALFGQLSHFDVVVSPVSSTPAVPHGRSTQNDIFAGFSYTMTHNLTGWPACVVRCGTSPDGLPIGVQIAAAAWREDVVLSVALELERACGGWQAPNLLKKP